MKYLTPRDGEPIEPWFAPLEVVAHAVAGRPEYRFFDVDDFMLMVKLGRSRRPDISLYKHFYTRRYLNLDDEGNAYRYIPPRDEMKGDGRYVTEHDLDRALRHLRLWELPWLKPGLERYRDDDSPRRGRHGHLRVV